MVIGPLARPLIVLGATVTAVTALGVPAHATYGARVTADEPQYLLSALSLGRDGDLDIANQIEGEAFRPFHRVDLDPQTVALGAEGRHISPHDPGLAMLLAVPARLGGWMAVKAALAGVAGALGVVTAWLAVRRFGVAPRTAVWVTGTFACSAPLATYATQVYPEIVAALATTVAVAAVTGSMQRRGSVVLAACVVALPWLSVKYVPVAVALVAVALWRLRHRPSAAVRLTVVLGSMALLYLVVHHRLYGGWTPYATGDQFARTGEASVVGSSPDLVGRSRRLVGLLVDRGFGLGAWAPAWLFAPVAAGAMARLRPRGGGVLAVVVAAGWLTASFVALTMHGWWWPGRQLVVVLPCVVVAVAWLADRMPRLRPWVASAGAAGVITWCWTTFEAVTRRRALVVDFTSTANPLYRLWRLVLPDGRAATTGDDVLLSVWAVAVLASAGAGWFCTRRISSGRPAPRKVRLTTSGR